eukprot:5592904-Pleurochrysis_carterae.AAC.1
MEGVIAAQREVSLPRQWSAHPRGRRSSASGPPRRAPRGTQLADSPGLAVARGSAAGDAKLCAGLTGR